MNTTGNHKVISNKSIPILVVLCVLLFGTNNINAQDTIFGREPTYIYPDNWDGNPAVVWDSPMILGYYAQYYFTDTPLQIIGIAISSRPFPHEKATNPIAFGGKYAL